MIIYLVRDKTTPCSCFVPTCETFCFDSPAERFWEIQRTPCKSILGSKQPVCGIRLVGPDRPNICRPLWKFGPTTQNLGPSSSNIQYLTRPDQKLSKNIYFIGSEWYISLYVLGKSCSVSHLQQLNLGQNYLTKIGARPDKFCHKNDPGVVVLA